MKVTKNYLHPHFGMDGAGRDWSANAIAAALEPQLVAAPPNMLLPPARVLAIRLGVTPKTVELAYAALATRELVRLQGRKLWIAKAPEQAEAALAPAPALKPVVPANRPARGTPGYITLSSAFLDPRNVPRREIAQCMRAALRDPGPS